MKSCYSGILSVGILQSLKQGDEKLELHNHSGEGFPELCYHLLNNQLIQRSSLAEAINHAEHQSSTQVFFFFFSSPNWQIFAPNQS